MCIKNIYTIYTYYMCIYCTHADVLVILPTQACVSHDHTYIHTVYVCIALYVDMAAHVLTFVPLNVSLR